MINKYNVPGPRYTSYPTVPYWDTEKFTASKWIHSLKNSSKNTTISVYIHLPFCEQLCTFCGCNKRITKNHKVEIPYIETLIKEWLLYVDILPNRPIIKEIHLGGGTPTFFSPQNLKKLLATIFNTSDVQKDASLGFEGHPNNTTKEHLMLFKEFGFNRISLGVQDYNLKVQKAINRIQPFEKVKETSRLAKKMGFESLCHDLIYGLPFQTLEDVLYSIKRTKAILPDRIALYSYAHVPWIKGNGQRGFKDEDLPKATLKREMYVKGKELLLEIGYREIGMDHFALETDSLYKGYLEKTLHRNFMGYTSFKTEVMIGLGTSAISDSWQAFAQNEKKVETYQEQIDKRQLAVFRGHHLTDEDLIIRRHILNLMCQFYTSWEDISMTFDHLPMVLERLNEPLKDGLIDIDGSTIRVLEKGEPFIRNICMAFDLRLHKEKPSSSIFSMTI